MRAKKIMAAVTAASGVLSLLSLVGLYLALHDIAQDYASPAIIREHARIAPGTLPEWTACALEWRVVAIGFCLILLFHVFFLVGFIRRDFKQSLMD